MGTKIKGRKQAEDQAAFEKEKAELCKELENGVKVFGGLGKGMLLSLLKYYFEDTAANKSKEIHNDLVVLVQLALDKRKEIDKMTNDALTDLSCQGIKAVTTASMEVEEAVVQEKI